MKAIGYIRVSTEEQANSGLSLSGQAEKIKAYCSLNDIELVEIVSDAGLSGKNTDREGLQKILSLCGNKAIDAIIVYKLDRLSRKTVDVLNLIETFEKKNVAFHSIVEKIDTKSAIGKFFLTITAAFAQMERDTISERTSFALKEKRRQGKLAGNIPYGFDLAADGETLIENKNEMKALEIMTELRARRVTFKGIVDELHSRGYRSKSGGLWYAGTIQKLLEARK